MKKLLLIVNSVAGRMQARGALYDIVDVFCKADYIVTVGITAYRGHAAKMAASAEENGYDLVVCAGGDGTINEVLHGLLRGCDCTDMPLGYIPCGSTNDFAETLGLSTDIVNAALAITEERGVSIDVGKFEDDRYFAYIATFGAFAATSYNAPQQLKNTMGHFAYVLQGIKDLSNIKEIHAKVTADGLEYEGDYIFASVSNTKSVGGVVKLDDDMVDLKDGLFELTLVKYPEDFLELSEIVTGVTYSDFSSPLFTFVKAKDIVFTTDKLINWSLDGEMALGETVTHIRNLHKAVTLFR